VLHTLADDFDPDQRLNPGTLLEQGKSYQ